MEEGMQAFMDKEEDVEMEGEGDGDGGGGLEELLSAAASDIEAMCDDLDHDALMDPSLEMGMEDTTILMQGLMELDEALIDAMKAGGAIEGDAARDMAMSLLQEGAIEDGSRFAGWLQRASQVLAGTGGSGEEGDQGADPDFETMSDSDLDTYVSG